MDHGDAAQLAALCGAVGASLVLLPVRRVALLAGLALLAVSELGIGWALAEDDLDRLARPAGLAAVLLGAGVAGALAALFVRWPALTPLAVVAVAPFRLPVELGDEEAFLLVPLYGVLAAAVLALAVRSLRGDDLRAPPVLVGVPSALLVGFAGLSLLWSQDLRAGSIALGFFFFPFATLVAVVARSPVAEWLGRALVALAIALAAVFALVGLWQWRTEELFFARDLEVANTYTSFFRVTSLFKDPSLYGRALVLAVAVVLVALWLGRITWRLAVPVIALLFAGLYVSYSQSSFVTLFAVTLAVAFALGERRTRVALGAVTAVVALTGALLVADALRGDSAQRVTGDRSRLVDVTTSVVAKNPVVGVGIGAQPRASAEEAGSQSKRRNASHTTPLTVAAELGAVGLLLYLAFLAGTAWMLLALVRAHRALGVGLAAVFLALVVHSLMYSGFFEDPLTWTVVGLGAAALASRGVEIEPVLSALRGAWARQTARGIGLSRGRVALAAAASVLLVAGVAMAVVLQRREPPDDGLVTALEDVTLVAPTVPVPEQRPVKKRKRKRSQRAPAGATPGTQCWLTFGGDERRSLARTEIDLGRPTKPEWARAMGSYMEYPPSYCDGVLYVNTDSGKTVAVDAQTGKPLWARRARGANPSTPAIAGPLLIVSSYDGTVTAMLRRNGRRVWQLRTGAKIESSPIALDGIVYFGSTDGRLFALRVSDGRIRWAYDTGGRITSSPSIIGHRVCITTYAGSIFCLRRSDGRRVWRKYIRRDSFRYESFYASPSTDGRRIFTVARSGKVVALSVRNGAVLWTAEVGGLGYSTPAVGDGRVIVGGFDGYLRAFRSTNGRPLWRTGVPGRILGPALVVGDLVFFSTLERRTYAARVTDGRIVWRFNIGKYAPGIATERHYYFSLNGLLVAFRGQHTPKLRRAAGDGEARAASAAPRKQPRSKRP
ncbi:MAG: PQQ-binding-like beta-propeller repeat protein [Thermoleophilia bacterium]|nr:PQQ-binding-like beta-propeller repeat protein [Thermoleophilia bacterium]